MAYLTRWEPFGVPSLMRDWNRFWSLLPTMSGATERGSYVPAVDVIRHGEDMVVRAELPGVAYEDLDVEIEGSMLTIKADRHTDETTEGEDYLVHELDYGHFERTLRVPTEIKPEEIRADFHDGILEVTLPKAAHEAPAAHHIEIHQS